ncbi:MAG: clostripain-related cysteine peptidase, partial [Actinomycetota bacterium]
MTKHPRSRVGVLIVTVIALCLLGQVAAVSPVGAEDASVPAAETRQAASLSIGERLPITAGAKPAGLVQPDSERVPTADSPIAAPGPGKAPVGVTVPTRDRAWNLLMAEGFEGAFPSGGWDVFDNDGAINGEYFWDDDDYMAYTGSWSAWAANGGANGLDPYSYYYPNNMDSWMVYGPFDLSGYTDAEFDFYYWNQSEACCDPLFWGASADGFNFSGYDFAGDSGGWVYDGYDLSGYVGDSSVWIAFVFQSDGSVVDDGPFVDDIALWGYTGGAAPANDDFDAATVIGAAPFTATQNVAAATIAGDDPGFPCAANSPMYRTVWYRYTPPSAQTLTIDTFGSDYDTVLGVWTGSRGSLSSVACNDDTGAFQYQSRVDVSAAAGVTYFIEVADYSPTSATNQLTLNLAASGGGGNRDWTFMVYLDGDNNLEAAAVNDFLEMSSVGSNADVNIVVQFDRITGYDTSYDNWTDTRRFLITPGMTPTAAAGTSIGEANMGDPATLVNFVQWAMTAYPAEHYALVLWDHGSGWRLRTLDQPSVEGIAYDDTSGGDGLDMLDLRSALNTLTGGGAQPFDLVGLDACLMAMIEVDNQMRPYADVRVTSQETEPGDGWPYDTILGLLEANPAMTAAELGTIIVDLYYASYGNDETQSAVDLGGVYDTLNTAVDEFAAALIANGAGHIDDIEVARLASQDFFYDYYIDLWDFADWVNITVDDPVIDAAALAVQNAVLDAVIHEQSGPSWPWAQGISIYFPETSGGYDARYDGSAGFLEFTADTRWDEWIHAYHGYVAGLIPPATFGKLGPADGATGQSLSPTLSWGVSSGATSYTYCYDTTNDNACTSWASSGPATSAALSGLAPSTTYYWQVRANNAFGTTHADGAATAYWDFTTSGPPGAFGKVSPGWGATSVSVSPALSWGTAAGATSYEYCYDTTDDNACGSWVSTGTATSAPLAGLTTSTIYYWQVRASNGLGTTYADGGATAYWPFVTDQLWEASFRSVGSYDGWVRERDETSAKGGALNATNTTARLGDDASDRQYRSILHFDTSTLPDNAVVTGVTIKIRRSGITGTNPFLTHGLL